MSIKTKKQNTTSKQGRAGLEPGESELAQVKVEKNIVLVSVDAVQIYERNAKKHTPWQVQAVAKAIQEFGFNQPLVLDGKKVIIAGHCRLESAKSLGMTHVPCIIKTDLTPPQVRAYRLLDNKLNESIWDRAMAQEDVKEMGPEELALLRIGYDDAEIRELSGDINQAGLTGDDDAPELPKKARSSMGDLYELGDHRLLCGDATLNSDVGKLMGQDKADLIFTDPPYNVAYEEGSEERTMDQSRLAHRSTQRLGMIKNDKMSDEEFKQFLRDAFGSYRAAGKDGVSLYVCHASSVQREFQNALEGAGFLVRCQIIWSKNTFAWGFGRYKFQHEPIFYAYVNGEKDPWYGDKTQSTIWEENKPSANRLHPTMKPVELIMRAVGNSSKAGDIVLDLFGGSGSTLIACEKMRRRAFLMELDPRYVDVIVQRWEQFTGRKAKLVGGEVEVNKNVPLSKRKK